MSDCCFSALVHTTGSFCTLFTSRQNWEFLNSHDVASHWSWKTASLEAAAWTWVFPLSHGYLHVLSWTDDWQCVWNSMDTTTGFDCRYCLLSLFFFWETSFAAFPHHSRGHRIATICTLFVQITDAGSTVGKCLWCPCLSCCKHCTQTATWTAKQGYIYAYILRLFHTVTLYSVSALPNSLQDQTWLFYFLSQAWRVPSSQSLEAPMRV